MANSEQWMPPIGAPMKTLRADTVAAVPETLAALGITAEDLITAADAVMYLAEKFGRTPVPEVTLRRRAYVRYVQGPPCAELAELSGRIRALAEYAPAEAPHA